MTLKEFLKDNWNLLFDLLPQNARLVNMMYLACKYNISQEDFNVLWDLVTKKGPVDDSQNAL